MKRRQPANRDYRYLPRLPIPDEHREHDGISLAMSCPGWSDDIVMFEMPDERAAEGALSHEVMHHIIAEMEQGRVTQHAFDTLTLAGLTQSIHGIIGPNGVDPLGGFRFLAITGRRKPLNRRVVS